MRPSPVIRAIVGSGIQIDAAVAAYRATLQAAGTDFVGAGLIAFNTMVVGLKADATWNLISDMHLLCGIGTMAGALKPLKTSIALADLPSVNLVDSTDYIATGVNCGINSDAMATTAAAVRTMNAGVITKSQNSAYGLFGYSSFVLMAQPDVFQASATNVQNNVYGGADFINAAGRVAGDVVVGRVAAGNAQSWLNGVSMGTLPATTTSPSAGAHDLLRSDGFGQVSAYFLAPGATLVQALSIRNRIQTALQSIGRAYGIISFVGDGDSLTYGLGVGVTSWMTYLKSNAGFSGRHVNVSFNGRTTSTAIAAYNTGVLHYRPDATYSTRSLYFSWLGTNDLGGSATAAATLTNLRSLWASARANGYRVIAFTIMPRADGAWTGAMETQRLALNASIIADSANWDALIRVDTLFPDPNNTTLFQADKLHLTDAGELALANQISTQINPLTV